MRVRCPRHPTATTTATTTAVGGSRVPGGCEAAEGDGGRDGVGEGLGIGKHPALQVGLGEVL